MLLLYLDGPDIETGRSELYLHSTMLLLYPCFGESALACEPEFTFHYASTLSEQTHCQQITRSKFTFHYASTLSQRDVETDTKTSCYLHSTMLLLYRVHYMQVHLFTRFTFHYASTLSHPGAKSRDNCTEFTFHYASTLSRTTLYTEMQKVGIYIPLCFYFIDAAAVGSDRVCTFTFHYASTLSKSASAHPFYIHIFTFHYASTLSTTNSSGPMAATNLHSTMLLLLYIPLV